mgnify:FL=1
MSKIISYLKNLELHKASNEILATRIFLVLFLLSLTLQLTKVYISSPTQAQF